MNETSINELTLELKTISDYEQFKIFSDKLKKEKLALFSKRTGKQIFNFSNKFDFHGYKCESKERIHYLYDDSVSVGESRIKNLYKYFEIDLDRYI